MVRGRLVEVNGRKVGPENYTGDRAQRLVDREFNLSYAIDAPSHNRITAGRWFREGSDELSIEEGIANTLGLKLGDAMTFDIAGQRVTATHHQPAQGELGFDACQLLRAHAAVAAGRQAGELHHRLPPAGRARQRCRASCCASSPT